MGFTSKGGVIQMLHAEVSESNSGDSASKELASLIKGLVMHSAKHWTGAHWPAAVQTEVHQIGGHCGMYYLHYVLRLPHEI